MHGEEYRVDPPLMCGVLAAPADLLPRLVTADWAEENGRDDAAAILRAGRVPLDDLTVRAARHLLRARTGRARWDGEFIADVASQAAFGARDRLSAKQVLWVWKLFHKYRRQRGPEAADLLAHAARVIPPAGK